MGRTIYLIWPGRPPGQQAVWSWLQIVGLAPHVKFIQQVDAFLEGRQNFPDRIDLATFDADRATRLSFNRDWHPEPPELAMPDYEADGDGQSSMWQGWVKGYPQSWVDLWSHFTSAVKRVSGLPCGAYGIPIIGKDPVPVSADGGFGIQRWLAARPVIDLHDWVALNLYPPGGSVPASWMEDEEGHRQRAASTFKAAQLIYRKRVIPMLWPRWGVDNARYGEVYCDALATAGADSLALWINPHSEGMARAYIRYLSPMLPALKRFAQD
jgi:hypothetical protein